jgi:hypothetical protein
VTRVQDEHPPGAHVLDLHLGELKSVFHALDPAPFRERDLDPRAHEYIVEWAREAPAGMPLGLSVRVDLGGSREEAAVLRQAIDEYFHACATSERRQLRQLLRRGRLSLVIGLGFVTVANVIAEFAAGTRFGIIRDSVVIGAWVALWRPIEIFLYDWWPMRATARLYDRLATMTVSIRPAREDAASHGGP